MADRFPELSENDSTSLVDRKNSENTKKGTKVALNVFRECLKERKVDEESLSRAIDMKEKLANAYVLKRCYAELSQKKAWRALHHCESQSCPMYTNGYHLSIPMVHWYQ